MLIDFAEVADDTCLITDICIIGAGAAGITLARGLSGRGLKICIVESGGFDHDPITQSLGVGDSVGMPYYELQDSRLRFFGGTTNIWGGRCAPLDDIDFAKRDWVPHSGWPIAKDDLAAGYRAAHRDLDLGPFDYSDASWRALGIRMPAFAPDCFATAFWRFDECQERFSARRAGDLLDSTDVQVLIHASAVHLQAQSDARRLAHVVVAGIDGHRATVRASAYVLACGGIENARLMLVSRDVEPHGIGNRHDQVGRFFMEHAHGRLGHLHAAGAFDLWNSFRTRYPGRTRTPGRLPAGSVPMAGVVVPAPALQQRLGILNTALTFKWQRKPDRGVHVARRLYQGLKHQMNPSKENRRLWHAYRGLRSWYQRSFTATVSRALAQLPGQQLSVMIRAEQAPNPNSRVMLAEQNDALGYPRANLDWQLGQLDKYTLCRLAETLGSELARLDLGSFEPASWLNDSSLAWPIDPTVGNHPIAGYHHMGTTRMSDDPKRGVVDSNCAVHGYGGLYVAGSSVFPTGSWANPTLTILALVHRLKDHLVSRKVAARSLS